MLLFGFIAWYTISKGFTSTNCTTSTRSTACSTNSQLCTAANQTVHLGRDNWKVLEYGVFDDDLWGWFEVGYLQFVDLFKGGLKFYVFTWENVFRLWNASGMLVSKHALKVTKIGFGQKFESWFLVPTCKHIISVWELPSSRHHRKPLVHSVYTSYGNAALWSRSGVLL